MLCDTRACNHNCDSHCVSSLLCAASAHLAASQRPVVCGSTITLHNADLRDLETQCAVADIRCDATRCVLYHKEMKRMDRTVSKPGGFLMMAHTMSHAPLHNRVGCCPSHSLATDKTGRNIDTHRRTETRSPTTPGWRQTSQCNPRIHCENKWFLNVGFIICQNSAHQPLSCPREEEPAFDGTSNVEEGEEKNNTIGRTPRCRR